MWKKNQNVRWGLKKLNLTLAIVLWLKRCWCNVFNSFIPKLVPTSHISDELTVVIDMVVTIQLKHLQPLLVECVSWQWALMKVVIWWCRSRVWRTRWRRRKSYWRQLVQSWSHYRPIIVHPMTLWQASRNCLLIKTNRLNGLLLSVLWKVSYSC